MKKIEKRITRKFTETQKKLWEVLIFLSIFAISATLLHLLIWINWNPILIQKSVATIVSFFLSLVGITSVSLGTTIHINGFGIVEIIKDCIGWKSFIALVGLILASRGIFWKNKVFGIATGILFIFVINILRLVTTIILATKNILSFEVIHSFLWQWGLTILVLVYWILWIKISTKLAKKK